MASGIDGKTLAAGNLFDDLVPDATMKTGGMGEQNRRTGARPLPNGKLVNPKQMHVQ